MKKHNLFQPIQSNKRLFTVFIFAIPVFLFLAISLSSCSNYSQTVTASKESYNKKISEYNWDKKQRKQLSKELAGIFNTEKFENIFISLQTNVDVMNGDNDVFLGDGYIAIKEWLPAEEFRIVFFSHKDVKIPQIEDEKIALAKTDLNFK